MKSQDWTEIYVASLERAIATQYSTNYSGTLVTTQRMAYAIYETNDPSGRVWYDGTNPVVYKAWTGAATNSFVFTNTWPGTFLSQPFRVYSIGWDVTTNRYIRGPYTNINVSGVIGGGFNKDYTYHSKEVGAIAPRNSAGLTGQPVVRSGVKLVYTNANDQVWDYTGGGSAPYPWSTNFDKNITITRFPEEHGSVVVRIAGGIGFGDGFLRQGLDFTHTPPFPDFGYGPWDNWQPDSFGSLIFGMWTGAVVVGSGLTTNMDGSWADGHATVPMILENYIGTTPYKRDLVVIGDSLRSSTDGSNAPNVRAGAYVDDTQATDGTNFVDFSDVLPEIITTNLWAQLGIGDGTNLWSYEVTNATVQMLTNLTEVYSVANRLRWTHGAGAVYWYSGTVDNVYLWSGNSTVSWAAAQNTAQTSAPTISAASAAPYAWTEYDVHVSATWVTTYTARAKASRSILTWDGVSTNIGKGVDFYMQADAYNSGYFSLQQSGSAGVVATNRLQRFATIDPYSSLTVTSAFGQTSLPSLWPATTPTPAYQATVVTNRGFFVEFEDIVAKWDFLRATNALP